MTAQKKLTENVCSTVQMPRASCSNRYLRYQEVQVVLPYLIQPNPSLYSTTNLATTNIRYIPTRIFLSVISRSIQSLMCKHLCLSRHHHNNSNTAAAALLVPPTSSFLKSYNILPSSSSCCNSNSPSSSQLHSNDHKKNHPRPKNPLRQQLP